MPRYRISYAKKGPAKFMSHLDMARTFERSLRRAGLPVALSQGFNPHAKISFGFPLPVGVAGLEEYMDVELAENIDAKVVASSLNNNIPSGFEINAVCILQEDLKSSLMAQIESSIYLVVFEDDKSMDMEVFRNCLKEFMAMKEILVKRKKKKGTPAIFDIRPGILALSMYQEADGKWVIRMDLMSNSNLNVRPREVIEALRELYGVLRQDYRLEIVRSKVLAQGGKDLFNYCSGPVERP